MTLEAQLEVEEEMQREAGRTRDFVEGVAAFMEKRHPKFTRRIDERALAGESNIGVVGAGAMGSGIAQVAATYGHKVLLFDQDASHSSARLAGIEKNLARSVEKKRSSASDAAGDPVAHLTVRAGNATDAESSTFSRTPASSSKQSSENLAVKRDLFGALEIVVRDRRNSRDEHVVAIGHGDRRGCTRPERVLGIHFFNPPTVLPLVEIVPGLATAIRRDDARTGARSMRGARRRCIASDTPGFIVNRIARPFYGEALRIYEEGIADMATIDWAMRDIGGFRMGPFELMDFIGNDVNFAATKSVYEATYYDPRLQAVVTQQRLFEAGFFGRKSVAATTTIRSGRKTPEPSRDPVLGEQIFERILAMLINEAADAALFVSHRPGHRSRDDERRELPEGTARLGRRDRHSRNGKSAERDFRISNTVKIAIDRVRILDHGRRRITFFSTLTSE